MFPKYLLRRRTSRLRRAWSDNLRRQTTRGTLQEAEEVPAMVHPPPKTNAEQQPGTDIEPFQTTRRSPATMNIEALETDDLVIAYVIQLLTVKCLT